MTNKKPKETEEQRTERLKLQMEHARNHRTYPSDIRTAYEEKIASITEQYEEVLKEQEAKLNITIDTMKLNFNNQIEQNRLKLITEHTDRINKIADVIRTENEANGEEMRKDIENAYITLLNEKEGTISYLKEMLDKTIATQRLPAKSGYNTNDLLNGSYTETLKHTLKQSQFDRIRADTFY
jgi:hypothetical protein